MLTSHDSIPPPPLQPPSRPRPRLLGKAAPIDLLVPFRCAVVRDFLPRLDDIDALGDESAHHIRQILEPLLPPIVSYFLAY